MSRIKKKLVYGKFEQMRPVKRGNRTCVSKTENNVYRKPLRTVEKIYFNPPSAGAGSAEATPAVVVLSVFVGDVDV